jgi:hypothetical protein
MSETVLERCTRYVRSRQCPDGGFCFYRAWGVEESNAADTFAAVRSFQLLSQPVPNRQAVLGWLSNLEQPAGTFQTRTIAFFALASLRALGTEPSARPDALLRDWIADLRPWAAAGPGHVWSDALADLARLVFLSACYQVPLAPAVRALAIENVLSLRGARAGFGRPGPNLIDTCSAAVTLRRLGAPCDDASLQAFLRTCEHEMLGFVVAPETTAASVDVMRAGVMLDALLGNPFAVSTLEAARRFVLATQNDLGGFGRAAVAIATLHSTRSALEVLFPPESPDDVLVTPP